MAVFDDDIQKWISDRRLLERMKGLEKSIPDIQKRIKSLESQSLKPKRPKETPKVGGEARGNW